MRVGLRVGLGVGLRAGIAGGDAPPVPAAAVLSTLDLSTPVATDSTPWNATLTWFETGTSGNMGVLDLAFSDGSPATIEVRDGERYELGVGWVSAPLTIGVLAIGDTLGATNKVADIEAAINATSLLAQVTDPDPDAKDVDMAAMDSVETSGSFSGGA